MVNVKVEKTALLPALEAREKKVRVPKSENKSFIKMLKDRVTCAVPGKKVKERKFFFSN